MIYPQFALDWLESVYCNNTTYAIHFYKVVKLSKHFLWTENRPQIMSPEPDRFFCCHLLIQNGLIPTWISLEVKKNKQALPLLGFEGNQWKPGSPLPQGGTNYSLSMHVLPEKRPRAGPLPSPLERLPDRTEGMSGLGSVCASTPSLLWPQEDSSLCGIRFLTRDL